MVWFHKYWTLFLPAKCNVKENKSSSQHNSRHRLDKKLSMLMYCFIWWNNAQKYQILLLLQCPRYCLEQPKGI